MKRSLYPSKMITKGPYYLNTTKKFIDSPGGLAIAAGDGKDAVRVGSVNIDLPEYTSNAWAFQRMPEFLKFAEEVSKIDFLDGRQTKKIQRKAERLIARLRNEMWVHIPK